MAKGTTSFAGFALDLIFYHMLLHVVMACRLLLIIDRHYTGTGPSGKRKDAAR